MIKSINKNILQCYLFLRSKSINFCSLPYVRKHALNFYNHDIDLQRP